MACTILDTLRNARYNLIDNRGVGLAWTIGKEQLDNAMILLEKGYCIDELIDPILDNYGDAKSVPEKKQNENS